MDNWKERTELLLGKEKLDKLQNSHVLVVGLGGVGAYAAEQIARSGVGCMTIIDGDTVHPSNRNRQLLALVTNHDKHKAILMQERLLDINPDIQLNVINDFITEDRFGEILDKQYDYVVDAIDTLTPKVHLILNSLKYGHNIISSMGTGGKLDPSQILIADISETHDDGLARMLRKRLHKLGVYTGVKSVFSPERINPDAIIITEGEMNKRTTVGTISYMPAIFGNYIASEVIRDLLKV